MKLVRPHDQIFVFLGDSPSDLGSAFMRPQEFFESPSKIFRRRYFTVEKFKKWYCRTQSKTGAFTYYGDFGGYNIPGNVFFEWMTTYAGRETEDEQRLLTMLGPVPFDFYIIGAPKDCKATLDHEFSHSFFHLFPGYRNAMETLQWGQDLEGIHKFLKAHMYCDQVLKDEVTSYLMFDEPILHRAGVSTKHLQGVRNSMRRIFDRYKKDLINPRLIR